MGNDNRTTLKQPLDRRNLGRYDATVVLVLATAVVGTAQQESIEELRVRAEVGRDGSSTDIRRGGTVGHE